MVGLGSVDNTADADKPVSTAMQTALNAKLSEVPSATADEALGRARDNVFMTPKTTGAVVNDSVTTAMQRSLFNLDPAMIHTPVDPGISYLRYSSDVQGPASTMALFAPNDLTDSPRGPVLQLRGDLSIAPRDVIVLETGRKYRVRWEGRRVVDSSDPSGDAVEFGIAWLNRSFTQSGLTIQNTVLVDYDDLTTADGWVAADAVISAAAGTGIDVASSEATFARPYVQQYGADDTFLDVRILAIEDVTDKPIFDDPSAAQEARITDLEGINLLAATLLSTSTDLDSIDTAGEYYGTSLVNGPGDAPTVLGVTVRAVGANRLQTAYSASGSSLDEWMRLRSSGTWGAWVKNASKSYVDTLFQSLANSIPLASGDTEVATVTTDGTSDVTFAYGAQYLRWERIGNVVHFWITISFTPTYTSAGSGGVFIGDLPFAADAALLVNTIPVNVKPSGNVPQPSGYLGLTGHIAGDYPSKIGLRFERETTAGAEARGYALSELPSGVEVNISAQGSYPVAIT
jgi:hypothetical protein